FVLPASADYPVTVVDDRGREIAIANRPERIVTILPLYVEILVDLGEAARIVGVVDSPNNPPQVADRPRVGSVFNPSVEQIVALQPDVVLGAFGPMRDSLENLGVLVFTGGKAGGIIDGITEIFRLIRNVGLIVDGNLQNADRLIGSIAAEVITVEAAILDQPKPIVVVLYPLSEGPPFAATRGTPENEIVVRAGGRNAFTDLEGYPQVSFEELLARDPDIILTDPTQISLIMENESLKGLQVIRNGRVLGVNASAWISSRIAGTVRLVAELLHPDAFETTSE
ncbi:MAG: ABC transporter substrate-binding protein, partial [Candidatus Bipolaricaulia bacterium]